jgi:hypothetical protein
MKKSLRIARGIQLLGALFLVLGIVSCSQHSASMSLQFIAGLALVLGARIYEW